MHFSPNTLSVTVFATHKEFCSAINLLATHVLHTHIQLCVHTHKHRICPGPGCCVLSSEAKDRRSCAQVLLIQNERSVCHCLYAPLVIVLCLCFMFKNGWRAWCVQFFFISKILTTERRKQKFYVVVNVGVEATLPGQRNNVCCICIQYIYCDDYAFGLDLVIDLHAQRAWARSLCTGTQIESRHGTNSHT